MSDQENIYDILIIGAGYTGLSCAYYLAEGSDKKIALLEKEETIGGLAGSFKINGVYLEKFYHHWFASDTHIMGLIKDLGLESEIVFNESKTGLYYANSQYRLASPMDLLKLDIISLVSRFRLGFLTLYARTINNWMKLEGITSKEWLLKIAGKEVYQVIWEPLLRGKFGKHAEEISAVWFQQKIKLRGGSRNKDGKEYLAYYRGGFSRLADSTHDALVEKGVDVHLNSPAEEITKEGDVFIVKSNGKAYKAKKVVFTGHIPQFIKVLDKLDTPKGYIDELNQIKYIGNRCIVLALKHSLTNQYWLNVNDPNFPFVGLIEHTNFESKETYGGNHIVYLSKYMPTDDELFLMTDQEYMDYAMKYVKQMFPEFKDDWINDSWVYKEYYSQPLVTKHYSKIIPAHKTPVEGLYLNTMAQIYPEDRGTNYAVREGKKMALDLLQNKI